VATNLAVQLLVDGASVGASQNYDLNKGSDDLRFSDAGVGYVLQLEVSHADATGVVELRSILVLADIKPTGEII